MPSPHAPRAVAGPALAAPLLLLLHPSAGPSTDELRLALPPATELATALELTQRLELVDASVTMLGNERDRPEGFTLEVVHRLALASSERYPAGARDAGAELERTFDSVARSVEFDVADGDRSAHGRLEYASGLEAEGVRFTVVDGRRICLAVDEERPLDASVLAPLRADQGAWSLLPPGPIEVGDRWTVADDALRDVLLPGGRVDLGSFEQTEADGDDGDRLDELGLFLFGGLEHGLDDLVGALELRFEGHEDGRARVPFSGQVVCAGGDQEGAQEHFAALVDEGEPLAVRRFDVATELELEGVLLWDLDAGRAASLEWSAQTSSTVWMELYDPDRELDIAVEFDFAGDARLALQVH